MKTVRVLPVAVLAFFLMSSIVVADATQMRPAQQATATEAATLTDLANVVVSFPPIVSELHGAVQVLGTATLPGMRSSYLEVRPLNADASIPTDDIPWAPATLPISNPVQAGVLATWDTTLIPDGLYELRLTVTQNDAPSVYYLVTPLRVNNAQFPTPTPTTRGNFTFVPTVQFTLTPTPAQTVPLLNGIALNPSSPTCGSTFTVTVNVNNSTSVIAAAATVYVQDVDQPSGTVTTTGSSSYPALNPGTNYVVNIPLTVVSYYNDSHVVTASIPTSQISASYILAQGSCNGATTTPQPTSTAFIVTATPLPTGVAPTATTVIVPPTATVPFASATTVIAPPTATVPAKSATPVPATTTMPPTIAATVTATKLP